MTGLIRLIIAHYHDDCNTAATSSEAALNVPRGWLIAVELAGSFISLCDLLGYRSRQTGQAGSE